MSGWFGSEFTNIKNRKYSVDKGEERALIWILYARLHLCVVI
jgi:hypothetical protein